MGSETKLTETFPGAIGQGAWVDRTARALRELGFTAENAIAIVDVCRDELSQSLMPLVRERWGEAFNLCSLAGLFFAGRTALTAAMHHAPRAGGRERYVFMVMAHTAIDEKGCIGHCERPGVGESHACGALCAFLAELRAGKVPLSLDEQDLEQSLLRMRLLREIPYGTVPGLLELTRLVQRVGLQDLQTALAPLVDPGRCDHAILSGIQVHAPDGHFVAPGECFAVVEGVRHTVSY